MDSWSGAIRVSGGTREGSIASGACRLLAAGACFSLAACISNAEPTPAPDAIRIGAVLPFSGTRAASGVPLEAALRLAVDDVNAAGGLGGRPLWLDVADSHSDDVRGTANALDLIESKALPFFIGTEEPKIAYQITSAVKAHSMVHVMPALTSAQFHDPSATAAWFRISPSVSFIACALAKRVLADGLSKVSVVVDSDDYSGNFAVKFGAVLRTKANTALPSLLLDPHSSSYAETFTTLINLAPDAVVLMTSPSLAARFLQEWAVRGRPIKIYLGPTLKDPALLRNVPAGILEGVTGVSADLGEQSAAFAAYFETRTTVIPVAGSHYYFDAVSLLALAVAEGIAQDGSIPAPAAIKAHMLNVSSAAGSVVSFDRLAEGLALLAAGEKVSYSGAAGSYVLNALGDTTLSRGSIWQITGNDFVTVGFEQCDATDLDKFDQL
jgi:ABC-type branched-subunit amino acid transport system substrate-binding protein